MDQAQLILLVYAVQQVKEKPRSSLFWPPGSEYQVWLVRSESKDQFLTLQRYETHETFYRPGCKSNLYAHDYIFWVKLRLH